MVGASVYSMSEARNAREIHVIQPWHGGATGHDESTQQRRARKTHHCFDAFVSGSVSCLSIGTYEVKFTGLYASVNQYRVFLSLGSSAFCGRMSQCWPCLLAEKGDTLYFMVRRTTPVNFDRESKADAKRHPNSGWRRWRSGICKLTTR